MREVEHVIESVIYMTQKSIKKNTVYSIIKTGSSILFPLITFPYISRVLLTENVGKINFGLSIVSYFSLVASLGITTYAIRECSAIRDDKEKLSNTASQIFSINIITTIIAYLALAITLCLYRKLDNYRTLIILQSLTIIATTLGADWLNSAMEDFKYITLRTVAFQFISLLLMFVFVHRPEDYIIYALICLVSNAGANILNMWYRGKYCKVSFTKNIEWKHHLMPIIYLFVMLLAQTIFASADSTMLGLMHGDYDVGIYATAHKVSGMINQMIGSLLWVIMPRMAYYFDAGDYARINKLLRKVLGFNLLAGLPLAVGTFMLSDEIIMIVAGSGYEEASSVLKMLMISFAITLFGGNFLGNAILLPSKKEKTFMIVCCIAAVVNVIANYIFIPVYRALAAAWTTAFCALLIFICLLFAVDKRIKIDQLFKVIITPVVGCIGIIGVCLFCKQIGFLWVRTIVSIGLSVIVYGTITYLGKNELLRETIDSMVERVRRRNN